MGAFRAVQLVWVADNQGCGAWAQVILDGSSRSHQLSDGAEAENLGSSFTALLETHSDGADVADKRW